MPRTPQIPQKITREKLFESAVRLRTVVESLDKAAKALGPDGALEVIYAASLNRGIKSLEAVEPEIRRALAMFQMKHEFAEFQANRGRASQAEDAAVEQELAEVNAQIAETERAHAKLKRAATKKATDQAKSGRKKKSG